MSLIVAGTQPCRNYPGGNRLSRDPLPQCFFRAEPCTDTGTGTALRKSLTRQRFLYRIHSGRLSSPF